MYNSSIGSKNDENGMCSQSKEVVAKSSQLSRQKCLYVCCISGKDSP